MDPRNGIPVLEKKSHREQCSWIPITPVKPEQMRRPLHVHYITTRPEGTYQREHPDSLVGQPFKDVATWGNNVPFVQLLACTDAASAAVATQSESHTVSYCTPMHTQINGSNQQPSNSTALLLQMNQNLLPQMYQSGFLVPAQINSNLTCPQNNIDDVASNRTTSFQLAPGTPAQVRQIPNGIFAVPIDTSGKANNQEPLSIADEGRKQNEFYNDHALIQRNDSKSVVSPNPTKESKGHPYCLYPPSAAFSTPPESNIFNKGDDDGIVSIKTPQPKPPRRKKHRPKVITEGKPERTPRPVTTNQLNNKENPSGKRKYVRKTGPKASVTASDDLAETTATSREAGPKSCRRSLNFNMESHVDDACTNMGQFQQDRLITEGKPERAPRPVTTKQSNNKENPSGKRKYVRKTGPKASVTASADLAETTAASREAGPKSCRCSLNFNVESHVDDACTNMGQFQQDRSITNEANATASIVSDKFSPTCQNKSQTQKSTGSDASSGSQSTLQLTPGLELVVEKSPIGFAFDLTKSLTRLLENYLSLPENSSLQSPDANSSTAITRVNTKTTMRKNKIETDGSDTMPLYINVEEADCINDSTAAVHNKHESRPLYGLQDIQSATKAIHNSNNQKHVLLAKAIQVRKRAKREYSHIDFSHPGPMNLMNCKLSYISSNNYCSDCHVPDIYKRKRTEKVEIFRSTESSFIAQDTGAKRVTSSNANEAPTTHFKLQGMSRIEQKQQGHGKLAILHNQMAQNISEEPFSFVNTQEEGPNNEPRVIDGNGSPVLCQMRFKKKWHGSFQVCTLPTLALAAESEQNVSHGPQPCMEAEITKSHAINKRKKRKEKGSATRFLNSLSNFNANKVHQQDQNAAYDSNCQSSLKPRRIASLDSTTSFQEASAMSFSSLAVVPYKDPIEDIIQKFVCLNISGTSNPDMVGVLVPHGGDRTIVPYGPLEPIKKRRPRAKVDLDEETNRVWKLLMWKESSDRTEQADAEKEKWWEEERRIFRGRTDSFIARMHLVQGDRRFSQWKGSVVDSVVGVFLTQNVSDHLSSSAFMALAARFPLRSQSSSEGPHGQGTDTSTKEQAACILDSDENIKWGNREGQSSMTQHEADAIVKGITNLNESFENTMERSTVAAKHLVVSDCEKELCQESPDSGILTSATITDHASLTDVEDRHGLEDTVFSQISVISSENSPHSIIPITGQVGSSSESNIKEENMMTGVKCNDSDGFLSFTELLQMAGSKMFQELYTHENESCPFKEAFGSMPNQLECTAIEKRDCIKENGLNASYQPINTLSSGYQQATQELIAVPENSYSDYQLHSSQGSSGSVILGFMDALGEEGRCSLPSNAYETTETNRIHCTEKIIGYEVENVTQTIVQENLLLSDQIATASDSCTYKSNNLVQISSESELGGFCDNLLGEMIGGLLDGDTSDTCSVLDIGQTVNFLQRPRGTDLESEITEASGLRNLEEIAQTILNSTQKDCSNLPKHLGDALDAPAESLSLTGKYIPTERTELELNSNFPTEVSSLVGKYIPIDRTELELNSKDEACGSKILSTETSDNTSQVKKARGSTAKKKVIDWDSLRKQVCCNDPKKERNRDRMDSLDWEAIRCADVSEIADTIRERGMNNMLAERIKDFLNRIVRDHGSIDLEWLRDVPPDKAKEYLLSIRGLGLKSVECVRLLTLHHLAFPVDTNVGRICVRLGWVPLQPLPESLQLHLLEMYPVLESIQKYLWPRLCTLDQRTLYELHYQMITFGKVFCTKSRPNCNACPMRAECKHFASAFASARLALPGPEEKGLVSSTIPMNTEESPKVVINPLPLPPMERLPDPQVGSEMKRCEPIIEEPKTPEDECIEASEKEIEDAFWKEDPDEIPTIKLNIEEFTLNVQNYMQQNKMELQEVDMSKALVALTPEAASIPMPKLKNVSRLRTEHHVYELPDSHPLLAGLDRREPDDPCSYLLAIWTPGETAQSTQPPEIRCNSQESGNLCDNRTCFACNSVREAQAQTVRGTLLIPCRTAMRGSFPLNGTYFQVNEVFADHDSSLNPIDVPRAWIWNLPRRTVYFGTSIPTIFRGLTTEGIQHCFWRGFVCVRGFDQKRRAPRPLMARLHFPASKLVRARKASAKTE